MDHNTTVLSIRAASGAVAVQFMRKHGVDARCWLNWGRSAPDVQLGILRERARERLPRPKVARLIRMCKTTVESTQCSPHPRRHRSAPRTCSPPWPPRIASGNATGWAIGKALKRAGVCSCDQWSRTACVKHIAHVPLVAGSTSLQFQTRLSRGVRRRTDVVSIARPHRDRPARRRAY